MAKALSRWTVFVILAVCMFAYTYTYDLPVALQEQLQDYYNISNVQYTLLFSLSSWPNCVFPILVGILVDKIGVNIVIIACFAVSVIGNGLFVLGLYYDAYAWLLIARCIYGIGIESFVMAETPLIYEYFKGKELSFALGANLSFSRLGSSVNEISTYWFYNLRGGDQAGIVFAALMGFLLLLLSLFLVSALIAHRVCHNTADLRFASLRSLESSAKVADSQTPMMGQKLQKMDYNSLTSSAYSHDKSIRQASIDSCLSSTSDGSEGHMSIHSVKHKTRHSESKDVDTDEDDDKFRLSDLKHFDARFWLLVCNTCLIYGCVEPWMKIGSSFMQSVWSYSHETANLLLTVPYVTSAILTPFIGWVVDRFGYRCHLLMVAAVLLCIVHFILLTGYVHVWLNMFALVGIGVSYSMFCGVVWPSFAIIVNPKTLGTAYGFGTAGYNLFLGLFFFVVGILAKQDTQESHHSDEDMVELEEHKYKHVQYFLLAMSVLSIFTVSCLWYLDHKAGGHLRIPTMKLKVVHDLNQFLNEELDDFQETVSSVGMAKF